MYSPTHVALAIPDLFQHLKIIIFLHAYPIPLPVHVTSPVTFSAALVYAVSRGTRQVQLCALLFLTHAQNNSKFNTTRGTVTSQNQANQVCQHREYQASSPLD